MPSDVPEVTGCCGGGTVVPTCLLTLLNRETRLSQEGLLSSLWQGLVE